MDLLVGAGSLIAELVAGDVDDLQSLVVILLVHLFEGLVVGREAAAGRGVDDEKDLALELGEGDLGSVGLREGVVVNAHVDLL